MRIRLVQGAGDLKAFIQLPYRLHRADPCWVPPLRHDVRTRLSREKNPFFEHAEADYFLAERGGDVVGRIAAIANRLHNETHGDSVAFFGFFECVNDTVVARALLDTVAEWARQRGYDRLRGPASFSTNDECGLLVDGFDTPPTVMMPYNPSYYIDLLESARFVKARDLWAYELSSETVAAGLPERLVRSVALVSRRTGITVRVADPKQFGAELERLKAGYNASWERNWGFVPMTDSEFDHMARQIKPVYVPELVLFAEREGRPIAVALGLPDLNEVLRSNRSGRLFPGALKLLWNLRRKKITRLRVILLGVLPEFRGKGIDAVLIYHIWSNALRSGMNWCEAGWVLENNPAMGNAVERIGFDHYKTYRLYDRAL